MFSRYDKEIIGVAIFPVNQYSFTKLQEHTINTSGADVDFRLRRFCDPSSKLNRAIALAIMSISRRCSIIFLYDRVL